jgi:hypothetical protein
LTLRKGTGAAHKAELLEKAANHGTQLGNRITMFHLLLTWGNNMEKIHPDARKLVS